VTFRTGPSHAGDRPSPNASAVRTHARVHARHRGHAHAGRAPGAAHAMPAAIRDQSDAA